MGYFSDKRSANLRVWHWLSAITVFGLMLTYLLRKTVLNYKDNAAIIQSKLSEIGLIVADDKAKEIAKIFRDNMWQWHYYLGFLFAALLAYRIYGFMTKTDKLPTCKAKELKGNCDKGAKEFVMAKYAHALFYVASIYMAVSGLVMYFREKLGLSKAILEPIKELHELAFWFFLFFIVAHIVGVIKAELSSDKGIVSEMFNGGK